MFAKKVTPELCKKMRKNAGLSQAEFAQAMGWSLRTAADRENKEFKLTLSEFEQFILVTTSSKESKNLRKEVFKKIEDALDMLTGSSKAINDKQKSS